MLGYFREFSSLPIGLCSHGKNRRGMEEAAAELTGLQGYRRQYEGAFSLPSGMTSKDSLPEKAFVSCSCRLQCNQYGIHSL